MSKTCTKCGETKPLDDFHRDKTKAGGRKSNCKECERERKRRFYEENREKVLERKRRFYEENREKVLERDRRYREENREKVLERKRRYYEENRDKRLEYRRRYREENRDILNQGNKIYQAQNTRTSNLLAYKKGAPYSPEEDALILADNGMTTYQKAIELGRTYPSVRIRKHHLRARANH